MLVIDQTVLGFPAQACTSLGCGSLQVTTVAQLTVLQPVSRQPGCEDGPLCLVNTHLFFHPQAPHIRTLHVAAMLAEAHALAESAATELGSTPALLFCGDLNSDLNDGMPGETHLLVSTQMHTHVPECTGSNLDSTCRHRTALCRRKSALKCPVELNSAKSPMIVVSGQMWPSEALSECLNKPCPGAQRLHEYWVADAGALELLQSGELSAEHWDWACGAGFSFTRDEDMQENGSAKASSKKGNG